MSTTQIYSELKEPASPYINRFLSADTIVPGYANPQNLNRYSYVLNNPLKYTDPTGHKACGDEEATNCDTGLLNNPSNHKNKGCGGPNKHCLGKTKQLKGRIKQEIDRRFDPIGGWLPVGIDYATSEYPTYDYYTEQAYEHAGFDLLQIASQNQDNPMTEADWLNSGVDMDYIWSKGVRGKPPAHEFFLNYMGRDVKNPSNYETNYLAALMETHPRELQRAKTLYEQQLLEQHGSLQTSWDWLQATMDAMGPDIFDP